MVCGRKGRRDKKTETETVPFFAMVAAGVRGGWEKIGLAALVRVVRV